MLKDFDSACSDYAKIKAIVGVVIAIVIGVGFMMFGDSMEADAEKYTQHVTATVTNKNPCTKATCKRGNEYHVCYDCNFDLKYDKGGKTIVPKKLSAPSQDTSYKKGGQLDILCDKNDATNCTMNFQYTMLKNIAIFGGFALISIAIIYALLIFYSTWFRRLICVRDTAQMINRVI